MKTTHSPVVSKIDNRLEQYTSAAQVGVRSPCVSELDRIVFRDYNARLQKNKQQQQVLMFVTQVYSLLDSRALQLLIRAAKMSDFLASSVPAHQILHFSYISAALSLQRENKESRSPRSGVVDLPVVTDSIRNIKSMWEKGSVFSSPGGGGGQLKVKKRGGDVEKGSGAR